jgi:glucose/arabinose dehydrogenase
LCYESAGAENPFPSQYQHNLFVGLAGGSNPATGHKIVRVEITHQGEQTIGVVSDFMTGLGRPVDILQYSDGSLLVLDYDLGQIYQISYTGN